ncbi:MAG: LytTR family DNA-binding domain-containing protein [Peptococcaceae bacterium]|jgi:DNA-binding LytR/AlgR family response regulator|nr:LytTR family DNA-binding domain-containing protein [Peptococcaceae bacterium]
MSVRIAVCDDDSAIGAQLEACLLSLSHTFHEPCNIEVYPSGEALYQRLGQHEYFDIIFLDIEMERLSGIEIGRRIREEFQNESTQIVYISGRESYAMALFESRPLHFLIKPLQTDKVAPVLQKALALIHKGRRCFECQNGRHSHKVPLRDILYFESAGKKIHLVTPRETIEFYGKLSAVEQQLDDDFISIHKSYLVNYYHVIRYTHETVALSNQVTLPISRQKRKDVSNQLLQRRRKGARNG